MAVLTADRILKTTTGRGPDTRRFTLEGRGRKRMRMVLLIAVVVLVLVPGLLIHVSTADPTSVGIYLDSLTNPSEYGQPVTFKVDFGQRCEPGKSCRSIDPPPGGDVLLFDGTVVGSPLLVWGPASDPVEFTVTGLSVGQHNIIAEYSGDVNYTGGMTNVVVQEVGYGTITTVTSSDNPHIYPDYPVFFTAHVVLSSNNQPVTAGTVTFYDNGYRTGGGTFQIRLGSADVGPDGDATFTPTVLAVGSYNITARYDGCTGCNDLPSTSDILNQIVSTTPTTTTTNFGGPPIIDHSPITIFYGAYVTYWNTTTQNNSPVTDGTVTFWENTTQLETDNLDSHGFAPFQGTLPDGSHNITAVFNGYAGAEPSRSASVIQVVEPMPTTTTTNLGGSPITIHDPVSVLFSAHVAYWDSTIQNNVPVTYGTVTFWENTTQLETDTLEASGSVKFHTSLPEGSHNITVVYNGGSGWGSSSVSVVQVVEPMPTTTTTDLGGSPITVHDPVSVLFSANVTYWDSNIQSNIPVTDGTVTFWENTTRLETDTLDSSGSVQFHTTLPEGSHNITVVYNGVNGWGSSSISVVQVVVPMPTTTTVITTGNPIHFGDPVTFTANVTWSNPPVGTIPVTDGTVTFRDGTTTLGTGNLNASGYATFIPPTPLPAGSHSITAEYNGRNGWATSTSGVLTQTVLPAVTTTTVASSVNPSVYGQPVHFTATISSNSGIPAGTVQFFIDGTPFGSRVSLLPNGNATSVDKADIRVIGSPHNVTAVFSSTNPNYAGSQGKVGQTVNKASTTTKVASSVIPSVWGQPVRFTATVSSNFGKPAGTVQFFIDGTPFGSRVSLLPNGNATSVDKADITVSGSPHNVTAVFSNPDQNFAGSQGKIGQTVNKASTTTALTSSSVLAGAGVTIIFNATVATVGPGAGTPAGTVTFKDGTTTLGTATLAAGGRATFTTSTLAVGTHQVSASYGGAANFNPSQSKSPLTITTTRAPVVTSFAPGSGTHGTTMNIAVLGNYFQNGVTAKLRQGSVTIPVTVKSVTPPSRIAGSVSIPASARGRWNIVITNTDGGQGTGVNVLNVL